jgi:hypothetical protein
MLCAAYTKYSTSLCAHMKPGVFGVLLASSHPFLHSSVTLFILLSNFTDSTKESPEEAIVLQLIKNSPLLMEPNKFIAEFTTAVHGMNKM